HAEGAKGPDWRTFRFRRPNNLQRGESPRRNQTDSETRPPSRHRDALKVAEIIRLPPPTILGYELARFPDGQVPNHQAETPPVIGHGLVVDNLAAMTRRLLLGGAFVLLAVQLLAAATRDADRAPQRQPACRGKHTKRDPRAVGAGDQLAV